MKDVDQNQSLNVWRRPSFLNKPMKKILGNLMALSFLGMTAFGETAAGKPRALVGAYYFDGWSGLTDHITPALRTKYAVRQPLWGWKDDTVSIMRQQVDYAADHSIAFWAFDWYYPEKANKETPLNHALGLFLKAPNRERMRFCLLVSNHGGYRIGPADWPECCRRWIALFQEPTCLRVAGKPLLIILSPTELEKAFGGPNGVRKVFDELRNQARQAGIKELLVAACTGPDEERMKLLVQSGYDVLTGYGYNMSWALGSGSKPFRELISGNQRVFGMFAKNSPLPFVPAITTGWDRRPADEGKPADKQSVWYADRSPQFVEEFVKFGVRWLDENPKKTLPQRLLLLYAWNEFGEGGYLTPSQGEGTAYLEAVRRAVTGK